MECELERRDIFTGVVELVKDINDRCKPVQINEKSITENTTLAELNMDSLDEADIIISIEKKFDIKIPYIFVIYTIGDCVDIIMTQKN